MDRVNNIPDDFVLALCILVTNSEDSDKMLHNVEYDKCLHWLITQKQSILCQDQER